MIDVREGNCLDVMRDMIASGLRVQSVVTDPPYHLSSIVKRFGKEGSAPAQFGTDGAYARASRGFMGKQWDGGDIAFRPEVWRLCFELLPPGGHLLAFGGTRTYHRMACAIEDAGFEIRDQIGWLYGSGFPKSHDVSKGIDREAGAKRESVKVTTDAPAYQRKIGNTRPWMENPDHERDGPIPITAAAAAWSGWGTALKPAWEPIVLARKPLNGTVAENVQAFGTGVLNINASRVHFANDADKAAAAAAEQRSRQAAGRSFDGWGMQQQDLTAADYAAGPGGNGRWPANVIHDGSPEVLDAFPDTPGQQRSVGPEDGDKASVNTFGDYGPRELFEPRGDGGSAARFFYCAKADAGDRLASKHPTVKPVDLMAYLVRLVTPRGGIALDPFAGSGTTGMACMREGFSAVLIEREAEYVADIRRRLAHVDGADTPLFSHGAR